MKAFNDLKVGKKIKATRTVTEMALRGQFYGKDMPILTEGKKYKIIRLGIDECYGVHFVTIENDSGDYTTFDDINIDSEIADYFKIKGNR